MFPAIVYRRKKLPGDGLQIFPGFRQQVQVLVSIGLDERILNSLIAIFQAANGSSSSRDSRLRRR